MFFICIMQIEHNYDLVEQQENDENIFLTCEPVQFLMAVFNALEDYSTWLVF